MLINNNQGFFYQKTLHTIYVNRPKFETKPIAGRKKEVYVLE